MRTLSELRERLGERLGRDTARSILRAEYAELVLRLSVSLPAEDQEAFCSFALADTEITRRQLDELSLDGLAGSVDPEPTVCQEAEPCSECGHHAVLHVPVHESRGLSGAEVIDLYPTGVLQCRAPGCPCSKSR